MDAPAEKLAGSNLTPIAEYTETAAALADLRQRHAGVVYDVTVPKEMKLAKEARAELRGLRTGLEKKRVEIKAPALERCRLIDAEAKRITGELIALEDPIDLQIKTEETRAEAEKLAKFEAERLRVEAIQKRIDEIRNLPSTLVGKPSVIIAGQLAKLRADELSEDEFAEQFVIAREAHTTAIVRVEQLLAAQQEADAEKKRQAERDAEMEAMRKKMAEQQRSIDEAAEAKRVEQERLAQMERDRIAAEKAAAQAAEQARVDSIHAQIAAIRNVPDSRYKMTVAELDQEIAAIEILSPHTSSFDFQEFRDEAIEEYTATLGHLKHLRHDRVTQDAKELADRVRREQEEAALQAERDRQAVAQKKLDEQAAQLKREREAAAKKAEADRLANLGLREAAQALVDYCDQDEPEFDRVNQLINDIRAALVNDAAQAKPARAKRAAQG